jgi:hypothetical protein
MSLEEIHPEIGRVKPAYITAEVLDPHLGDRSAMNVIISFAAQSP